MKARWCSFFILFFLGTVTNLYGAWYEGAEWYDQYYQYRIPIEVSPSSTGLQVLNITSDTIVTAINQLEEIHHSAKYFDYNRIKVIEYDNSGQIVDEVDSAGFFFSYASGEIIYNGGFEIESGGVADGWSWNYIGSFSVVSGQSHDASKCLKVESPIGDRHRISQGPFSFVADTFYLFSYWSKAVANTGGININISDLASSWANLEISYMPGLRSKYWTRYEVLLNEDSAKSVQVNIERLHIGKSYIDDVSLKEVRIDLLFSVDTTGPKKYMIYYQPTHSVTRIMPERRIGIVPAQSASPSYIGAAKRYDSIAKYKVHTGTDFDIWFAATTKKITPNMSAPSSTKSAVEISSAINERQSFQLVFKAKSNLTLDTATLGVLSTGSDTIAADSSYVKIEEYVNMDTPSNVAHNHIPRMVDMLEEFTPRSLPADTENLVLWFTVIVDSTTNPGLYNGDVTLTGGVGATPFSETVSVNLKVHNFALPDKVTFKTAHGGTAFGTHSGGGHSVNEFHGVSTVEDQKTLIKAYFDVMMDNKDCPYNVGFGQASITYEWSWPPYGTDHDEPGNFFYLHSFDFEDYNTALSYWVDTKHANSFLVVHTDGYFVNTFRLYPNSPVAWDHPDTSYTSITKLQYETLITDYWDAFAYNLIENGWIDYAFISVDESEVPTYPKLKNYCDVLHAADFAKYIRIGHDVNVFSIYTWKENPDTQTEISFKDAIDIWTTYNGDDNYNYYEDYYFTEHNMDPAEEEIWFYYTRSAHQNIDTHGLNNRCLPMKNYFFNSTGFLDWASFIYEIPTHGTFNPRIDPYSTWGNGAVAYFYPPGDTLATSPDFTITPSARLEMFREGIEDFEYMVILDDWMDTAAANSIDTSSAESLKEEIKQMFPLSIRWSVNDEYYLQKRESILDEIDKLKWYSTHGEPSAQIAKIWRDGSNVKVNLFAKEIYRYNLLRTTDLISPSWAVVDTMLVSSGDTITLIDNSIGGAQKAFYKVEAVIPP